MRRLLVALVAAIILVFAWNYKASADAGIDGGTNALRASIGLAPLGTSPTLTAIAQQRAQAIVTDFSHDFSWWAGTGCYAVGENIAWRSGTVGGDWAVQAWWASPDHHANMVDASGYGFNVQGSAIVYANGNSYFVQEFGKCGGTVQAAPAAPQPVSTPALVRGGTSDRSAPQMVVLPDTAMAHRAIGFVASGFTCYTPR